VFYNIKNEVEDEKKKAEKERKKKEGTLKRRLLLEDLEDKE
jgi:hypothetical protein